LAETLPKGGGKFLHERGETSLEEQIDHRSFLNTESISTEKRVFNNLKGRKEEPPFTLAYRGGGN